MNQIYVNTAHYLLSKYKTLFPILVFLSAFFSMLIMNFLPTEMIEIEQVRPHFKWLYDILSLIFLFSFILFTAILGYKVGYNVRLVKEKKKEPQD